MERRHDIDWLRVIAIGLLLIYHIGIAFQPWGLMIGFIQSDEPLTWLWTPMAMLNVGRIPFLFYVSGMGMAFAMKKRTLLELLQERSKRILLPFVFGFLCIVPIHLVIFQKYYQLPIRYAPHSGHLWFLGNLVTYIILLCPLFYWLQRDNRASQWVRKVFASPLGLLIVVLVMVAEVLLVQPDIFEMYALSNHGFFLGLLAFLLGYCFIHAGAPFWELIDKWKAFFLTAALILYIVRVVFYSLKSPDILLSLESNLWVLSVLAFGKRYLNSSGKWLKYLSRGAYPIYVLHMIFLYLGSALLFKTSLGTELQFVLLTLFTFAGCLGTYEVLKRAKYLKILFGMS